jgi:hypothetical protein
MKKNTGNHKKTYYEEISDMVDITVRLRPEGFTELVWKGVPAIVKNVLIEMQRLLQLKKELAYFNLVARGLKIPDEYGVDINTINDIMDKRITDVYERLKPFLTRAQRG